MRVLFASLIAVLMVASVPAALTAEPAPLQEPLPLVDAPETVGAGLPLTAPASDATWARDIVATLPRATTVNDRDGNKVWDDLEHRFLTAPTLRAVVTFTSTTTTEEGLAAVQGVLPGLTPTHTFRIIPGFAAPMTLTDARLIAALDEVRQIEYDHPALPEMETASAMFGADFVVDGAGFTGDRDGNETSYSIDDVVIAVLDTGIHGEHVDLDDGKIVHFKDFANDPQSEAYDPQGHGSHVAGIAAGTGDGDPRFRGVAPGAALVGVKIVGSSDTLATTIEAYEWLVDNKDEFSIDIATISFGFGQATDGTSALELAVDKAWDAGITCFKSAGNSGSGRTTITIPGAARGIIAVGSMLDAAPGPQPTGATTIDAALGDAGFLLSSYSSRGPTTDGRIKPDIVAPGQSITSVSAGTNDGYVTLSGTSMASPFTAGAAALVLDANANLTPDDVRDIIQSTADDWGLPGPDVDYGPGRLQVDRAVEEALRRGGHDNATLSVPIHPYHEMRSGSLGAPFSDATIEVNDTTHAFAVTAIVEGVLAQLLVLDPDMVPVASLDTPGNRQHQVGFNADATGTYTIRLVGQPGVDWVVDVSHGVVPDGIAVPSFSGILESSTPDAVVQEHETPAPALAMMLGTLALLAVAARRSR